MRLERVGAAAMFFQGITPALVFGFGHGGGLLLLLIAVIYALFAWGVWASRRWALISAIILTAPQLLIISSKWFSWRFFVGSAFGAGVAPSPSFLDTRICSFFSNGVRFDFAVSEPCSSLLANFTYISSETFVLVNAAAFLLLAILLTLLSRQFKARRGPQPAGAENAGLPQRL